MPAWEPHPTADGFPTVGESDVVYLARNAGGTPVFYEWNGSAYVQIGGVAPFDPSTEPNFDQGIKLGGTALQNDSGTLLWNGSPIGGWTPSGTVAYQGDNISEFNNDAGYLASGGNASFASLNIGLNIDASVASIDTSGNIAAYGDLVVGVGSGNTTLGAYGSASFSNGAATIDESGNASFAGLGVSGGAITSDGSTLYFNGTRVVLDGYSVGELANNVGYITSISGQSLASATNDAGFIATGDEASVTSLTTGQAIINNDGSASFANGQATISSDGSAWFAAGAVTIDASGNGAFAGLTVGGNSVLVESTPQSIDTQTGTTYTLALADANKLVALNNASAIALTVPTNASVAFTAGHRIDLTQLGAGRVTIAGDSGVTVNSSHGLITRTQYSCATLTYLGSNTWLAAGDLATT